MASKNTTGSVLIWTPGLVCIALAAWTWPLGLFLIQGPTMPPASPGLAISIGSPYISSRGGVCHWSTPQSPNQEDNRVMIIPPPSHTSTISSSLFSGCLNFDPLFFTHGHTLLTKMAHTHFFPPPRVVCQPKKNVTLPPHPSQTRQTRKLKIYHLFLERPPGYWRILKYFTFLK